MARNNYPDPISNAGSVFPSSNAGGELASPVLYNPAYTQNSLYLMDQAKKYGDVAPLSASDQRMDKYLADLQRSQKVAGIAGGAARGLESGLQFGQYGASGDPLEVGLGIGAGAASGAAAGAAGGLPGVLIGAGVGGLTAALSSYMNARKIRKQERAMRRLQKKAEAAEAKRLAKAEASERLSKLEAISNLKYDRAQAKVADSWNQWQRMSQWVAAQQAQSADTKGTFIKQGYV